MTSWAMLALMYAEYPEKDVIKRAAALIMSRQKRDGRWESEDTEGIFNKTCAIDYRGARSFVNDTVIFAHINPKRSSLYSVSGRLVKHISTWKCKIL